jgi:hypothetical protein
MARYYRARTAAPRAAGECVVQRFNGSARYTENIFDTDLFQIGDQQVDCFRGL